MVTEVRGTSRATSCLLLEPNSSLTFRGNLWLIVSLVAASLGVSIAFALAGAWMILPFAGLEAALLAVLLIWVYLQCNRRELLQVTAASLVLEQRGGLHQKPLYQCRFDRSSLAVVVRESAGGNEPQTLSLVGPEGHIEIGSFLTEEERHALLRKLTSLGILTRSDKALKIKGF